MKKLSLIILSFLAINQTFAASPCLSFDKAKLIAESAIQSYLEMDSRYKQDNPTVSQIVTLVNGFQFDGTQYTSELPYAGGNLTWLLTVDCAGKSYFDVEYTGSYDNPYGD